MAEIDLQTRDSDPNKAPGELERVRQFINTLNIESKIDKLGTIASAKNWLVAHDFIMTNAVVTDQDLHFICAVRESLRKLALGNNHGGLDQEAVNTLNQAAQSVTFSMSFSADAAIRLHPVGQAVQSAVAMIFATIYDAMKEGQWDRLKACQNDECQWVFYDQSKNRSGKWCSMAVCGSRMKVRAYRSRHTDSS